MKQFCALLLLAPLSGAQCQPAEGREYFVDYAGGKDDADGTRGAPWKHAPGDPAATAAPALTSLKAGDIVRFKAGVAYRGTVIVTASGSAAEPIIFTGSGFGDGRAIIDGADPVTSVTPCQAAADCGYIPNWADLYRVTFRQPLPESVSLYDGNKRLAETQSPVPTDWFYADDLKGWRTIPLNRLPWLHAGRIESAESTPSEGAAPTGTLLLWVWGNEVVRRPILGVDRDALLFNAQGLRFYTDRNSKYAIVGSTQYPVAPGSFALIKSGIAVANSAAGSNLSVGTGRRGFLLRATSNIVIRDLAFVHQTSESGEIEQGIAIEARGKGSAALRIEGNMFGPAAMANHQGAIRLTDVQGTVVTNNSFTELAGGSGIRTGARNADIQVVDNRFTRIGRTAIAFFGVSKGLIANNVIADAKGLHGNGISLYLDNRSIIVRNNHVADTVRPMTFHGDKKRTGLAGDHEFLIENNLFATTPDAQAALTSWGAATRGVTVRNNYLAGGKVGLLLNYSDQRVVVTNNLLTKIITSGSPTTTDWTISSNQTIQGRGVKSVDIPAICAKLGLAKATEFGDGIC